MTTAVDAPRRYQLGGQETRSLLGRREPAEAALLIGSLVAGVVVSLLSGGALFGFVVLAFLLLGAAVAVFLPVRGRTLFRWLPLDLRFALARRSGADRYRNVRRETGIELSTGVLPDVPAPAAVGRLRWLQTAFRDGELCVLVQQDEGALVAVLEVEGPGLGRCSTGRTTSAASPDGALSCATWPTATDSSDASS